MTTHPKPSKPVEYGNVSSFWVEYTSGLVDMTRSHRLPDVVDGSCLSPPLKAKEAEIAVDGNRTIRIDPTATAMVVVDMQNFFLHPELRNHPTGLDCINPLLSVLPILRTIGVKIIWLNWGLTEHELKTIPPSLVRGFTKHSRGSFGSVLPGDFGRLLMRGARNSDLYGPLHQQFLTGRDAGTDVWVHKNRMSGLWGYQTGLDLFLDENGIQTLLFGGVNTDQCVLGTMMDAYFRGYDCILVRDITATTSPNGLENVLYNTGNSYGFITDTKRLHSLTRGC